MPSSGVRKIGCTSSFCSKLNVAMIIDIADNIISGFDRCDSFCVRLKATANVATTTARSKRLFAPFATRKTPF